MIEIKHLAKTFNVGEPTEVVALEDVTISINKNDFLVIVGSNGSGKSTLLNCISGNILNNKGEVWIDENDVTQLKEYDRAKWISRVFQNPLQGTAHELSILDNFRLAALRTKSKFFLIGTTLKFENKVKEKISILNLGLENVVHKTMGTLSGGQRQALTLLMSTMDDSRILLLDEPTAALDPKSAEIVINTANKLILQLDLTAILITHNLKEAISFGNRIIQMRNGKIIKDLNNEEKNKININTIFNWFQ